MKLFKGNNGEKEKSLTNQSEQSTDENYLDILPDHKKVYLNKKNRLCSWSWFKKKIFKNHSLVEWLDIFCVPLVILGATLFWNFRTNHEANQRYNADLVKNYINSVKELILDQYHHGKEDKSPEISVEEVEAFVRAKTSNILKALKKEESLTEKQNLINFLTEAGIGFFPPYQAEQYDVTNYVQNVCRKKDTVGYGLKRHPKDYTFYHFFCNINLQNANFDGIDLTRVILENANLTKATLRDTELWLANLQKARLIQVDLTNAILDKANLKDATITEATLDNASLNQANLRGASLWTSEVCKPENIITDTQSESNKIEDDCKNPETNHNTSLKEAKLLGANLQDSDLTKVDFSNAKMQPFIIKLDGNSENDKNSSINIPTNLRNANLEGANISGTDLSKANLRGAILNNAKIGWTWKISKTNLEDALYDEYTKLPFSDKIAQEHDMIKIGYGSDLTDKDLSNADLRNAFRCREEDEEDNYKTNDKGEYEYKECDASMKKIVDFSGTDLNKADLRGADLSYAKIDMDKNKLEGALYNNETILSSDFGKDDQAKNKKAQKLGMIKLFPKANLINKDLSYADLSGVNLSNTKLQDANLTSIDFDKETKFTDAEYDDDTELPFDRKTALYYGMRYKPHGEKGHNSPVDWSKPENEQHHQVDLRKAILTKGQFEDTILTQAKLQEADLTGANLKGADLTNANLQKANLTDADLMGANLAGVKLWGADLTDANLTNANLTDATLDNVKSLEQVTLCRTTLPRTHELYEEAKTRDCEKSP